MKSKNMNESIRYYLQLVIFYFFISNSSFGQILSTKQISNTNGLSNSDVRTIDQDKYGFMWIGTQDEVLTDMMELNLKSIKIFQEILHQSLVTRFLIQNLMNLGIYG